MNKIKKLGKTMTQLNQKETKEVFKEWKSKRKSVEEFIKELEEKKNK